MSLPVIAPVVVTLQSSSDSEEEDCEAGKRAVFPHSSGSLKKVWLNSTTFEKNKTPLHDEF